ncbi:hypothetical protein IT568_00955 [bacterium]|nr:hypothetical protein [bacterium]
MKNLFNKIFVLSCSFLLLAACEKEKFTGKTTPAEEKSFKPKFENGDWWVTGKVVNGWETRDKSRSRFRVYKVEVVDSNLVGINLKFTNSPQLRNQSEKINYTFFLDAKTLQCLQMNRLEPDSSGQMKIETNNVGISSLSPFLMKLDEIPNLPQFSLAVTPDFSDTLVYNLPYISNGYSSVTASMIFQQVRPIEKKDFENLLDQTLKQKNVYPESGYFEVLMLDKIDPTARLFRQIWHKDFPFFIFSNIKSVTLSPNQTFGEVVKDQMSRPLLTEWLVDFKRKQN